MAEYLNAQKKQEIFGQYGTSNKDTGSAACWITLRPTTLSGTVISLKRSISGNSLQGDGNTLYPSQTQQRLHSPEGEQPFFMTFFIIPVQIKAIREPG